MNMITRKLLFATGWMLISLSSAAQHTDFYQTPKQSFLRGKELFAEQRCQAARTTLENFLNTATEGSEARQEAEFYRAAAAACSGNADAVRLLNDYVRLYPVNTFSNELNFWLGTAHFNQRNYEEALSYFLRTDDTQLEGEYETNFSFMKGYCLLYVGEANRDAQERKREIEAARAIFQRLKTEPSEHRQAASYYYAYTEYQLGNYDNALPGFLALDRSADYGKTASYFIPQIYLQQGLYTDAIARAEKTLSENPYDGRNAELHRVLGESYFYTGNYQKSLENYTDYEKVFQTMPREDLYLTGVANYELQHYQQAIGKLNKVTSADDALTQNAYLYLGNCYVALDDQRNARMAFEAASLKEHNPQVQEEALYNYAISTYNTAFSPFNESVNAFRTYLEKYPNAVNANKAYEYLSNVYLTATNYEEAYRSIATLQTTNTNILQAKQRLLFNLGVDAFNEPDLTKAIDFFSRSLAVEKRNEAVTAQSLFWRGEAYAQQGRHAAAIADFKQFLTFPPIAGLSSLVNYNLGYSYFSEKNYTEAAGWFKKYLANESATSPQKYVDALNRLGDCYFQARDWENAKNYYTQSSNKKARNSDYATYQIAFVKGLQKDYNGKITTLETLAKQYPQSDYLDDALYEKTRAYIELNDYKRAIATLNQLTGDYPNSRLAPKGEIQKALLYYNLNQPEQAISLYKKVIENYPDSEEALAAFESLEKLYVDDNRVGDFIEYTQQVNDRFKLDTEKEDRLSFTAAETNYLNGKYTETIAGLEKYLKQYPNGSQQIKANYYLANSYLNTGKEPQAKAQFLKIAAQKGNPYIEEAAGKAAALLYKEQNYEEAKRLYEQQKQAAQSRSTLAEANLGILRCNAKLLDDKAVVALADEWLKTDIDDREVLREVTYCKAKSLLELDHPAEAKPLLQELIKEPRTAQGAEAYYLLADLTFNEEKKPQQAEKIITELIDKGSPHQYWIARCFILLADMSMEANDDFQAKQYLLSLQNNYKKEDTDIRNEIAIRLKEIEEREKK